MKETNGRAEVTCPACGYYIVVDGTVRTGTFDIQMDIDPQQWFTEHRTECNAPAKSEGFSLGFWVRD